jgi:hypothetical protein
VIWWRRERRRMWRRILAVDLMIMKSWASIFLERVGRRELLEREFC